MRSLHTKKGRAGEKRFLAEGLFLLEESLRHNWYPEKIFFSKSLLGKRGERLLNQFSGSGITAEAVSALEMKQISEIETCRGLLGIFLIPEHNTEKMISNSGRILLMDNISDPGNAGTLIRSALAFRFDLVVMLENSVEPYNSKVVRSSAGSIFGITILQATFEEIYRLKKRNQFKLVTADLKGEELSAGLNKIKSSNRLILAIGSEAGGLSKRVSDLADIRIRIEHEEKVDSLNAAVAGSIIMKELYERR